MLDITEIPGDEKELRLKLSGELDINSSPELEKYIFDRVGKLNSVILDMTDLDYISSAGIRVILKTDIEMRDRGSFTIENPGDVVYGILKTVNFHKFLKIVMPGDGAGEDEEPDEEQLSVYRVAPFEPSDMAKEGFPRILGDYFDTEKNDYLAVYDGQDEFVATLLGSRKGDTLRIGIAMDFIHCRESETASILASLEDYCKANGCREMLLCLYGDSSYLFEDAISRGDYIEQRNKYFITYRLADLLDSAFFIKGEEICGSHSDVTTYNDLTDEQRMMLMFNYGIDSSSEIDVVFSNFFVSKDEIKGILIAKEIEENHLMVYSMEAVAGEGAKLAIPMMIVYCINMCRTLMDEDAIICFRFDSEKRCQGLVKTLGNPLSQDILQVYNKGL